MARILPVRRNRHEPRTFNLVRQPQTVGLVPAPHLSRLAPLSKALVGFSNAKYAEGLSPRSVASYSDIVSKWIARIGDKDIGKVTAADPLGLPYDSC